MPIIFIDEKQINLVISIDRLHDNRRFSADTPSRSFLVSLCSQSRSLFKNMLKSTKSRRFIFVDHRDSTHLVCPAGEDRDAMPSSARKSQAPRSPPQNIGMAFDAMKMTHKNKKIISLVSHHEIISPFLKIGLRACLL